jgi:hypothetical protein
MKRLFRFDAVIARSFGLQGGVSVLSAVLHRCVLIEGLPRGGQGE